jgi:myo-inositol-1(or 4)-monophosphatase
MPESVTDVSPDITARIPLAKAVVLAQRERLRRDMGQVSSQWKADGSRVTATDHAISEAILTDLNRQFPEDAGLSEELLTDEPIEVSSRFAWVLDPIDGTNNFATGLAQCAISLGLLADGEPVYGVVYDAARDRLIHGGPGVGLWDGDSAVAARDDELTRQSLLGFHSPHQAERYPGHAETLVQHCKLRALGSSTLHLAYAAAGLFHGVVDHNVKLWDIAAGIALMRGGGGDVEFLANDPLPLRRFDVHQPRCVYVGGNTAVRRDLRLWLTEADSANR